MKTPIKNLSQEELFAFLEKINEKRYRATQLNEALYKKRITSFSEISNFSPLLIEKIDENFSVFSLETEKIFESIDGSKKLLFKTGDNEFIETVFLPNRLNTSREERNTLCVSTMIGCPVNCKFCATARLGFRRNLTTSEIIDQIFLSRLQLKEYIDNIVFMGMGEPFLNYANLIDAIRKMSANGVISKKAITISTIGIPEKIIDFANEEIKSKLAVSLHSPFDEIRQEVIPIAKNYKIEELLKALDYYYQITRLPITFEYILFKNLNDREEDVKKIARIARRFPSKINIIPFNDISFVDNNIDLIPATEQEIAAFAKKLYYENIMVITRKSQGSDIAAACGQLALIEQQVIPDQTITPML